MRLSADLQAFTRRLGHDFAKPDLLIRALTHPSASTPARPSNQRLEFLGDRVLGLIVADMLLRQDEAASEGVIAPRFNALVRRETCADVARSIDLGAVLRFAKGEVLTGGRRKGAVLADAMEAVIAAVYLDAGFAAAERVVLRLWSERASSVEPDAQDPKSALQEWFQARGQNPPTYDVVERVGPAHAPRFTIEVRGEGGRAARASAPTKRQAEVQAAAILLDRLEAGE